MSNLPGSTLTGFEAEVQQQVLEAQIAAARGARTLSAFRTGDSDVDGALEGGALGVMPGMADDRRVLFDTLTGEPREVPVQLMAKTLAKRRNGAPAFSISPSREYVRGTVMCLLHPDHPDRGELAAVGLGNAICGNGETAPAGQLASEFDLLTHMGSVHKKEWAAISEFRTRRREEEDRQLRRDEVALLRQSITGSKRAN